MKNSMDRRQFLLQSSIMALCSAAVKGAPGAESRGGEESALTGSLRKAACIGVLPRELTVLERFKLAKSLGFQGIEPNTMETAEEVREYREASQSTGLRIHSVMNSGHWRYPLTDPDPVVVKQCIEGIQTSMQNAHELGADAVLVVPGIVTAQVRYAEVYERSQEQLRKLIPRAEELNVILAVENVGNRFLLSPLEFARYVDEFDSPFVRAYFDVGNIIRNGYPQDWIRTLGKRLAKIHIKRFEPGVEHPKFDSADRRTEGIDWPDVRKALTEVGYSGWVTAEVRSGDDDYLKELSARIDRIFAGQNPE